MPLARRILLDGQCATPVLVAKRMNLGFTDVYAMRVPHVVACPVQTFGIGDRSMTKCFEAERFLIQRLGEMGVQPHAHLAPKLRASAALSRIRSGLTLNGLHGASATRRMA